MLITILIITLLFSKTFAIVGGEATSWRLYPGLLVIKYIDTYCGGVFYEPNWVITAASCIHEKADTGLIGFGMDKLSPMDGMWVPYDFCLRHPDFQDDNGVTVNDIGVLRFSKDLNPFPLVPVIFSLSLPELEERCSTVGWGMSSKDVTNDDGGDLFKNIEANLKSIDQVLLMTGYK